MNSPSAHHTDIGETLPLFEGTLDEASTPKLQAGSAATGQLAGRNRAQALSGGQDRHMRAAWQLSKALKAAKNGRKAGRNISKLTPGQKHQVGNAICEHLLASLRAQVQSEKLDPKRH